MSGRVGRWCRWALMVCTAMGVSHAQQPTDLPIARIAILTDGASESVDQIRALVEREILTLTEGEFEVVFPADAQRESDWTLEQARADFAAALADPEIDLVINLGVISSHVACCQEALPKPVIAPVVLDINLQRFPFSNGVSGVHNLAYVALPDTLAEELKTLRQVVDFDKVAIVANKPLIKALPEIAVATSRGLAAAGIDFEFIAADDSADEVLEAIPADAGAVYVWPQFQMSAAENQRLIDGLIQRRLPGFAALNIEHVEAGMLATNASANFLTRIARRVALDAQAILLGEDAGQQPVTMEMPLSLVVNMRTARKIGVPLRWDVLIEAVTLYGDDERAGREERTLVGVVHDAIATNLDLRALRRGVASGAQEVVRARSSFRPQVGVSATGLQVDADRAAASFGNQPERSLTASGEISQLIYSDSALANVKIQRELQVGREQELEALRLDIAQQSSVAFLDVLRAKTLVNIQRSNLALTRAYLELAETRLIVGTAGRSEVLRWQSEIATARKSLVDAIANRQAAEIALNQVLHRPLGEQFAVRDVDLSNPDLVTGQDGFTGYAETREHFQVLQDFVVHEGLKDAPELKQLRAAIRAQELSLRTARRAYWAPTVSLQGTLDERISGSGAGSEPSSGLGIPPQDGTNWSIALVTSLPLFEGHRRRVEKVQASEELEQLRTEYEAVAEKIEQRIRIATTLARASHVGIDLTGQAADAAKRNLDLVSSSYARGAVSIIDLLDAQNAAFAAEQQAANTTYDFLVDLMDVERAASRFGFLVSAEDRESWYQRLRLHFEQAGLKRIAP